MRKDLLWVGLLLTIPVACTTKDLPYRSDVYPENQDGSAVERLDSDAHLGFVEFDDQGELWSSSQLDEVCEMLEEGGEKGPTLTIVFAHGWNHNASKESSNVQSFRGAIERLASYYDSSSKSFDYVVKNPLNRRIQGVYVGWRGRTWKQTTPMVDFWTRMEAGHRVAGVSTSNALFRVINSANRKPDSQARDNLVIVVGHSFGTIVIENSINRLLAAEIAKGARTSEDFAEVLPVDLLLLVNSAQTSLVPKQLIDSFKRANLSDADTGRPLIVSLTSVSDNATKKAFPIGVKLGRLFRSATGMTIAGGPGGKVRPGDYVEDSDYLERDQNYLLSHTAGHVEDLWSHRVTFDESKSDNRRWDLSELLLYNYILGSRPTDESGNGFHISGRGLYEVTPLESTYQQTPYWIMPVPEEVLPDHNRMWEDSFIGMVAYMLEKSRRDFRSHRKKVRSLDGFSSQQVFEMFRTQLDSTVD